jgi:Ca2+-binding RTX toxin-like protein
MLEVVHVPTHDYSVDIAVSGTMTLVGGTGRTEFIGGKGSTYMVGGKGNDTFDGGQGHSTMVGGSGHNYFEFLSQGKGGSFVIMNFVAGRDQLNIEGHSLSFLEQHSNISTHGGNILISFDGGKTTIELQGVATLKTYDLIRHSSSEFSHHNR